MINSVEFKNFKVLRDTTLPLGAFTLMVGPNGSGKSTALQALSILGDPGRVSFSQIATAGLLDREPVQVLLHWDTPYQGIITEIQWIREKGGGQRCLWQSRSIPRGTGLSGEDFRPLHQKLTRIRIYSLNAERISEAVQIQPNAELGQDGHMLAGVLDQLHVAEPERFNMLEEELGRMLPEFDRILFETPAQGARSFLLRTREGQHRIRALDLSQGTLFALVILTLAYIPSPPSMVCIEEPNRGIHPRLLRDVRDALYRLSYPESFGEKREPVQVVATTHSPYFLDLFKEHPEEIVIAHRVGPEARFERLSDQPNIEEILEGAHLGDVWYSGILGGVPSDR